MTKKPRQKKALCRQRAVVADCVQALSRLDRPAQLIIADPPYNFGQPYDAYDDNRAHEEYMAWTRQWVGAATEALDRHGAMWIFSPAEWVSEIDVLCRHDFRLYKRRHVIWCFTFGQAAQRNFTRSNCHLLYLTKTKTKFVFNEDVIRVPSARQLVYNDRRAVKGGKMPDDTWMLLREQLEPHMTPDRDTWLQSRVCGTFKERQKHSPNQLPVPLMERIVLTCSEPDALVVDPFCGTGSSGVACAMHGRDWLGFDVSTQCVRQSQKRIDAAR